MRKQTLQFCSLRELALYATQLSNGYILNTQALTLTGTFSEADILEVKKHYQVVIKEPNAALMNAC